eukprot:451084_1
MGSCATKLQKETYVDINKHNNTKDALSDTRLSIDKSGDEIKKRILKCPMKQMGDKIFSQTKSERQELWNKIDGINGAHLLSLHFYRRIYDNDNKSQQKDVKIKQFCSLFTDRPFAQAVDRVSRFMSSELNGDVTFWNVHWVNNVHCTHSSANVIISPLFGQMWYSFLCKALTDMEWTENVKQEIRIFFKDSMVFLFMDTWPQSKDKLIDEPMQGLLNEGVERVPFWEKQYKMKKADMSAVYSNSVKKNTKNTTKNNLQSDIDEAFNMLLTYD